MKETVKSLRIARGLTQAQLAQKIDVDTRWIQKLESGEISIENITFIRGIRLLRALYEDSKDPVIEEVWNSLNSVYILLRELIKESQDDDSAAS